MCEKLTKYSCGHLARKDVACRQIRNRSRSAWKSILNVFDPINGPCNTLIKEINGRHHLCPSCEAQHVLNVERQAHEGMRTWQAVGEGHGMHAWYTIDLNDERPRVVDVGSSNAHLRGGGAGTSSIKRAFRGETTVRDERKANAGKYRLPSKHEDVPARDLRHRTDLENLRSAYRNQDQLRAGESSRAQRTVADQNAQVSPYFQQGRLIKGFQPVIVDAERPSRDYILPDRVFATSPGRPSSETMPLDRQAQPHGPSISRPHPVPRSSHFTEHLDDDQLGRNLDSHIIDAAPRAAPPGSVYLHRQLCPPPRPIRRATPESQGLNRVPSQVDAARRGDTFAAVEAEVERQRQLQHLEPERRVRRRAVPSLQRSDTTTLLPVGRFIEATSSSCPTDANIEVMNPGIANRYIAAHNSAHRGGALGNWRRPSTGGHRRSRSGIRTSLSAGVDLATRMVRPSSAESFTCETAKIVEQSTEQRRQRRPSHH